MEEHGQEVPEPDGKGRVAREPPTYGVADHRRRQAGCIDSFGHCSRTRGLKHPGVIPIGTTTESSDVLAAPRTAVLTVKHFLNSVRSLVLHVGGNVGVHIERQRRAGMA